MILIVGLYSEPYLLDMLILPFANQRLLKSYVGKVSINAFNISCSECCLVYNHHNLSPCCDFASVHHCAPMICDDPIGAIEPVIGCISLGMLYRS